MTEQAKEKSKHAQLRERAQRDAVRAATAEHALRDLQLKYKRLERERNALLAQVIEAREGGVARFVGVSQDSSRDTPESADRQPKE